MSGGQGLIKIGSQTTGKIDSVMCTSLFISFVICQYTTPTSLNMLIQHVINHGGYIFNPNTRIFVGLKIYPHVSVNVEAHGTLLTLLPLRWSNTLKGTKTPKIDGYYYYDL